MRIAALVHFYIEKNRAGGEMMMHNLLKELAKKHEVTVFITDGEKGELPEIDGVKLDYGGYAEMVKYDPDFVFTHFQNTQRASSYCSMNNKKLATLVHNDMYGTRRQLLSSPRALKIYNSEWIKRTHKLLGIVIRPPVQPVNVKHGDCVTLVNVTPEKGSKTFYELAERMPDVKFLAVGGGYWKDKQVKKDLPNVTYIENTANMADDVYSKTRVILMASEYESWGMVAAEAMQSGIPTIAHPTKGLVENLGNAGVFVDRDDIDNWENEIRMMFSEPYYKVRQQLAKDRSNYYDRKAEMEEFIRAVESL